MLKDLDPVRQSDGTLTDPIKILIVEDSPNVNLLYDRGLPNEIFEKRFAVNGKDGLAIHDDWHPEIIILDVMLPEMSGYVVLKEIRNKSEDQSTIIMSTSLSGKDDVLALIKLGIQGYILKPFNVTDIGERILNYYKKTNPRKAGAALAIYEKTVKDTAKSSFKEQSMTTPEEDEKLLKIDPDFTDDDFTDTLTLEGFFLAFNADHYDIPPLSGNHTLSGINKLLQIPNLFEKIMEKKRGERLSGDIHRLLIASEEYRDADFRRLTVRAQKKIKLLNRLLLKSFYPDKIPEIKDE